MVYLRQCKGDPIRRIEQIEALLDALGVKSAHWVGNSFGGALTLWMAAQRPDLCDRLILMLNVLRPEVASSEVRAWRHYLDAPPLRLDALNPGWLRVPSPDARVPTSSNERSDEGDDLDASAPAPAPFEWLPARINPRRGKEGENGRGRADSDERARASTFMHLGWDSMARR